MSSLRETKGIAMNIYYLSSYHPYHKGNNPAFDHISGMLLSFKRGDPSSIPFWLGRVEKAIKDNINDKPFYVATVPSSTKGKHHLGFSQLIPKLSQSLNVLNDKGNLLKRDATIDKLATGGERAIEVHVNSLSVASQVEGDKPVVLLDDVTTTGNSMRVAISKLNRAGYTVILAIALGKTS
jgi:predicted amidophosphoribosyltransferase